MCVFFKDGPWERTGLRSYCDNDRTDEKTDARAMGAEGLLEESESCTGRPFDGGLTSKICTQEADA